MDSKTKILIACPFAFIIVLLIAANYIPFEGSLSETESRLLEFSPTAVSIKESQPVQMSGEFKSPIDFRSPETVKAPVKGEDNDSVSPADYDVNKLSLVVISGKRKLAVIDGLLVREGDSVAGMKIAQIEHDRVLLKNKTAKWLYLER